jgi:hypothetical protein
MQCHVYAQQTMFNTPHWLYAVSAREGKAQLLRARAMCKVAARAMAGVEYDFHLWLGVLRLAEGDSLVSLRDIGNTVPRFTVTYTGNGSDVLLMHSTAGEIAPGMHPP